MCLKKNIKNPVCETMVWSLVDRVKNLIEKNSAVRVRTWTVNVNTFLTTSIICLETEITVKDAISEGR